MSAWDLLTEKQSQVAQRVLREESSRTTHIAIALSGAHAYGFPSPDSDLDLKAVHVAPTKDLLGLQIATPAKSRLEIVEGVEIDYTSNEIATVLSGILQGNGNFLERILGPCLLEESPWLKELREKVRSAVSRRVVNHYRGFGRKQYLQLESLPTAKRALYVLRTTMTGTHLLLTGEVVTDVTQLLDRYGFGSGHKLVELKRAGEQVLLGGEELGWWRQELARAFEVLEAAACESELPLEPEGLHELEQWLVRLRCERLQLDRP